MPRDSDAAVRSGGQEVLVLQRLRRGAGGRGRRLRGRRRRRRRPHTGRHPHQVHQPEVQRLITLQETVSGDSGVFIGQLGASALLSLVHLKLTSSPSPLAGSTASPHSPGNSFR